MCLRVNVSVRGWSRRTTVQGCVLLTPRLFSLTFYTCIINIYIHTILITAAETVAFTAETFSPFRILSVGQRDDPSLDVLFINYCS